MNRREYRELIEFIQEYKSDTGDLTQNIQVLQFKVDLSKKVVELFEKKDKKLMGGKQPLSERRTFLVFENEFDNYDNAQLIVGRIQNRRLGSGFIGLQENEARVERLQFPASFRAEKYIMKVKENVVDEFIELTGEAGVSESDKELIATQLLLEQQEKMIGFRDQNRERALDMSRESGSDQQIATKNKEFISYRRDEYVEFDKAWKIKGEIDNDSTSYFKLNNIYLLSESDREKSFALFDINKYVQQAEKVVKDYTEKVYGDRSYLDSNDSDLIAMELLYEMASEM